MWPFRAKTKDVFLTNTLSGKKEHFTPRTPGTVLMYSCGPTVYGPQHIGNMRAAVFSDTIARTLRASGYRVKRVTNITDVGHLVGDGDEGEDKMSVGAAREKVSPLEIADRYTKRYLEDIASLNVDTSDIRFPRATDFIQEQIEMIEMLGRKGLMYETSDGVYFDTEKFPNYGVLGNIREVEMEAGARVAQGEKRSASDFVLWRKAKPNDLQKWDSPWGEGNPGWSIECSAMAQSLLAESIDIHTGGQEHIAVHHNNEIAQSEGASGKPFARYWIHNAFLNINGEKISKSLGNTYTLEDVAARNLHPLSLRYFFMQAHYRTPLSFSWESLTASEEALARLWKQARTIQEEARGTHSASDASRKIAAALRDDIGTPQALAHLWDTLGSALSAKEKWGAIVAADAVLGLSLTKPPEAAKALTLTELPKEVQELAQEREEARQGKDFARSDELRVHLSKRGYRVDDTPSGTTYTKIGE